MPKVAEVLWATGINFDRLYYFVPSSGTFKSCRLPKKDGGVEVSLLLSSSRLCSFLHSDPQATYHFYILSYFNMYKSLFAQLHQKLNPLKLFLFNLKHLISKLKEFSLKASEYKSAKVSGKPWL